LSFADHKQTNRQTLLPATRVGGNDAVGWAAGRASGL